MFSKRSVSYNPLIATFQLSSAASLNLGRSQNGELGFGKDLETYVCVRSGGTDEDVLTDTSLKFFFKR